MARTSARERPERECVLQPEQNLCPICGAFMRIRYENDRTLVTLTGPVRLRLKIRRCETDGCMRYHHPYRPEAEGAVALAGHEFGLDVIVLAGVLRHRDHRSVPEIHQVLREREAALPVFEADRQAKKELKKHVRGVRRIERAVEDARDPQAEVVRGYCAAVRSAITDDGQPPLAASGLKLKGRLEAVADSLERVAEKGGARRRSRASRICLGAGWGRRP